MTRRARGGFGARDGQDFLGVAMPHLDMLHSLARSLTRSREDAEDVVQDTMVKAFRAWDAEAPPRSMPAWLSTICINTVHSRGRRSQARPVECHDDAALGRQVASTDPALSALANLDAEAVRRALALLPDAQRETIVLIDLCGRSTDEVARDLGLPRGTVLSRLHRGHRRLAAELADRVTR